MGKLHEVIGVQPGASAAELRSAFKRRALEVHPDKGGTKEAFQRVLAAFEALMNPQLRPGMESPDAGPAQAKRRRSSTAGEKTGGKGKAAEQEGPPRSEPAKRKCPATAASKTQKAAKTAPAQSARTQPESRPHCGKDPNSGKERAPKPADAKLPDSERQRLRLLGRLHVLLRRLTRIERLQVISTLIPEVLRQQLAQWMAAAQATDAQAAEDQALSEEAADSDSDTSSSSNEDALPCLEAESSELLALGDGCDDDNVDPCEDVGSLLALPDCDEQALVDNEPDLEQRGRVCRVQTRGISSSKGSNERRIRYHANVVVSRVHVCARRTTDLAKALDDLAILATLKQRMLRDWNGESVQDFGPCFRNVLEEVRREFDDSAKNLILSFHLVLQRVLLTGR
eukprot:TRINITY_DN38336_c0_g1_i2.p1 TRINITY_DN38336_c0_g1~~TRINITY_DN38336_c0_g1_i2.p1  ORF type:complete len:398 (+),score=74.49 TRINITY_DN38336_c0_g1_i2:276-1469(+)